MTPNNQEAQVLSDEHMQLAELICDIETALGCESFGGIAETRESILGAIAAQAKTIAVLRERAGWECVCGSANGTVRTHCFNCDAERPTPPAAGGS